MTLTMDQIVEFYDAFKKKFRVRLITKPKQAQLTCLKYVDIVEQPQQQAFVFMDANGDKEYSLDDFKFGYLLEYEIDGGHIEFAVLPYQSSWKITAKRWPHSDYWIRSTSLPSPGNRLPDPVLVEEKISSLVLKYQMGWIQKALNAVVRR
jgi:hypothetical protein